MKTMIFSTKGTPAEVMEDINIAVENEKREKENEVEQDNFLDFTGATPDVER